MNGKHRSRRRLGKQGGRTRRALNSGQVFEWMVLGFLALALVVGGATQQNALNNVAVRLLSLPVMGWATLRLARTPTNGLYKGALWLLIAFMAVTLAQLVPLPPDVWGGLPGHKPIAAELVGFDLSSVWRPASLDPQATLGAFLGFLPPLAMFLAVPTMSDGGRVRLVWCVLGVAVASVMLGALQLAGGPGSPLRFYPTTNTTSAVGFFSNRNHLSSLLISGVCLLTFLAVQGWRLRNVVVRLLLVAMFGASLVGVAITGSRAGLVLLLLALAGCVALAFRFIQLPRSLGRREIALLVAVLVVPVVITAAGGWFAAPRLGADIGQDARVQIWTTTADLARRYFPLGTGGGSFEAVYRTAESPDTLTFAFVNHAHSDYLETWLEYGLVGVLAVLAALGIGAVLFAKLRTERRAHHSMPAFFALAALLLMLHSIVDYPLRTAALGVLFAFLTAGAISSAGQPGAIRNGDDAERQTTRSRNRSRRLSEDEKIHRREVTNGKDHSQVIGENAKKMQGEKELEI